MPTPQWIDPEHAYNGNATTPLEIIGIGGQNRNTKTQVPSHHGAYILMRIAAHWKSVLELLRRSHAAHYKRPVYVENENGERVPVFDIIDGRMVQRMEPAVLEDKELIQRYSALQVERDALQELLGNSVSVDGFSIKAASHLPDEERQRRSESSVGSERRGNEKW